MKAERCQAVTKSLKPCSATVVADGMCAWHAPSWAERRRQWSAEGGRKRSNRARARKQLLADLMTDDEIRAWLGVAFKRVIAGAMEPGVATAAGSVARAMVAVKQAGELEERLAELEARAGVTDQRRRS